MELLHTVTYNTDMRRSSQPCTLHSKLVCAVPDSRRALGSSQDLKSVHGEVKLQGVTFSSWPQQRHVLHTQAARWSSARSITAQSVFRGPARITMTHVTGSLYVCGHDKEECLSPHPVTSYGAHLTAASNSLLSKAAAASCVRMP